MGKYNQFMADALHITLESAMHDFPVPQSLQVKPPASG